MSDYTAHRPGGALKFKGDDGKKKKKKKSRTQDKDTNRDDTVALSSRRGERGERDGSRDRSRSRSPSRREERKERKERKDREHDREPRDRDERDGRSTSRGGSGVASPAPEGRRMTDAERRFEEVQRKRREERVRKTAHLTHKDRVSEFNSRLDSLSEHHDMPRIGPG